MKNKWVLVLFIIGLFFIWFFQNDSNGVETVEGLATPEHPVISPSGKYQLEVVSGYNGLVHYQRFVITELTKKGFDPEVIYCSTDTFASRHTTFFLWDDNEDKVWVYSGDLGIFYWKKGEVTWEKGSITREEYRRGLVPELLKQLRPA